MPTPAIRLWRSKRGGKARGFLRASWREQGRKVTWDTRELDPDAALKKAVAELNRRLSAPASTMSPTPTSPLVPEGQPSVQPGAAPSNVIPIRRPIGEAINRALGTPAPAAAAPSSLAGAATAEEAKKKVQHLYAVFGRAMVMLTEGGLKRACRWAGREPEEIDDDELAMIREGWEEKGADWFGKTDIGPWGKVALGSAVAGAGMYMAGKELPKPKELPRPKEQPADGANVRPERAGGDGGGGG